MDQIYKISESTKFPVTDNGQDVEISANTLLTNLQLLLEQAMARGRKDDLSEIKKTLDNTLGKLKYCIDDSAKSKTLSKQAFEYCDKVYNLTTKLVNQVEKLDKKNKALEDAISHLEYNNRNVDLFNAKTSVYDERLQNIESALKDIVDPGEGDAISLGATNYIYRLGKWVQQA